MSNLPPSIYYSVTVYCTAFKQYYGDTDIFIGRQRMIGFWNLSFNTYGLPLPCTALSLHPFLPWHPVSGFVSLRSPGCELGVRDGFRSWSFSTSLIQPRFNHCLYLYLVRYRQHLGLSLLMMSLHPGPLLHEPYSCRLVPNVCADAPGCINQAEL